MERIVKLFKLVIRKCVDLIDFNVTKAILFVVFRDYFILRVIFWIY